jgi:hypothetical protein
VTISELTVLGHQGPTPTSGAAILKAYDSQDTSVDRSSIDDGSYGFYLRATDGTTITHAQVASVGEYGVYGRSSAHLDISSSRFTDNQAVGSLTTPRPRPHSDTRGRIPGRHGDEHGGPHRPGRLPARRRGRHPGLHPPPTHLTGRGSRGRAGSDRVGGVVVGTGGPYAGSLHDGARKLVRVQHGCATVVLRPVACGDKDGGQSDTSPS